MRSSHVAIQFPRFRFRVISIARPFAPFTPALDEGQASRVMQPSLPQVAQSGSAGVSAAGSRLSSNAAVGLSVGLAGAVA